MPRRHAGAAIDAVRALADRIRPLLLVCEIRTVAADELWMSTSYGTDSVAIHFTWRPTQQEVETLLPDVEDALAPFGARPHWGKLFVADAATIAPRYDPARRLRRPRRAGGWIPRGVFRNAWLETDVLGGAG